MTWLPIPLNWLVGGGCALWRMLRHGPTSTREAYQAGLVEGRRRANVEFLRSGGSLEEPRAGDPWLRIPPDALARAGPPFIPYGRHPIPDAFHLGLPPSLGVPSSAAAAAEQAARARLRTLLTPEQFAEYTQRGHFTDHGATFTGNPHLDWILPWPYAIIVQGIPYCLQVSDHYYRLPPTDHVIHRLLMWRHDPAWVLRTAQRMDRLQAPQVTVDDLRQALQRLGAEVYTSPPEPAVPPERRPE